MTYTIPTNKIPVAFSRAHQSLWEDSGRKTIGISEQIDLWKQKFHVRIYDGWFENFNCIYCPTLEFESEDDFVMFMLEWS